MSRDPVLLQQFQHIQANFLIWGRKPDASLLHKPAGQTAELSVDRNMRCVSPFQPRRSKARWWWLLCCCCYCCVDVHRVTQIGFKMTVSLPWRVYNLNLNKNNKGKSQILRKGIKGREYECYQNIIRWLMRVLYIFRIWVMRSVAHQ